MDLAGKTAIVTGGSRGIGAAIAQKLAEEGANIAIVYAGRHEAAETCAKQCQEKGVRAEAYCCDVSDFDASRQTVEQIRKDFGRVDILINNAGVTQDGLLLSMKEEAWDTVLDTNLKGAFHMIRHCSGLFLRQRSGRIVNIASVVGMTGNAGQSNYAASKAGLIGLTKSTAKELGARGILCNAVAPGWIETEMTETISEKKKLWFRQIPLGRGGKPEEVAEAVTFLAKADYITGEVLRVDGGMAM